MFVFHWWLTCWFVHSYKVNNTISNDMRWRMAAKPSSKYHRQYLNVIFLFLCRV
ncbi:hypothetical protein T07_134 [Trichinella nelsoni]|uniref:Uncharacterized protein n=1 Tax=Trichinella nelsoni TaxID=6336 RepID=A0A0V0RBH4_9BILA|nr:hypothetical protein T07_134 [Trichinella nelsoni]